MEKDVKLFFMGQPNILITLPGIPWIGLQQTGHISVTQFVFKFFFVNKQLFDGLEKNQETWPVLWRECPTFYLVVE